MQTANEVITAVRTLPETVQIEVFEWFESHKNDFERMKDKTEKDAEFWEKAAIHSLFADETPAEGEKWEKLYKKHLANGKVHTV